MEPNELLLTTCRHSQQWSACLWDYSTGSAVHCYKNGGIVAPKSLNFVDFDYIISADEDKPMTHIWTINSQEPDKKLGTVFTNKIATMAVCPSFSYVAAGIGVKLYVWQLSSGKLFTIQRKNFQPITCVKFSSDSACLVVAGQDGMLIVYKTVNLVSLHNNLTSQNEGQVEPLYTKQDHSLPITDIHVGNFGHKSRLATVSSDNTCKLYNLASGMLLLNLVFQEPLTCVIFDGPCWNLYVGRNSGKIQQFFLKDPPRHVDHHVSDETVFEGHRKQVTCFDLGIWDGVLVSGSEDNFVFVWEIASRQILRKIEHKGAITNVRCVLRHENFFTQNLKVKNIVGNFGRDLIQSEDFVIGKIQENDVELSDHEIDENRKGGESSRELETENTRLRAANKQLYETALKICKKYNHF